MNNITSIFKNKISYLKVAYLDNNYQQNVYFNDTLFKNLLENNIIKVIYINKSHEWHSLIDTEYTVTASVIQDRPKSIIIILQVGCINITLSPCKSQ